MKQIKASEVQSGMEVQWTYAGITRQCTPSYVETVSPRGGAYLRTFEGGSVQIPSGVEVTVLSDPQPEEPTAFGARVVVNGRRFLRSPEEKCDIQPWLEENEGVWWKWYDLINMGPVTVIPDNGWTVPEATPVEAPVVPDRIEEWPEDDTALRPYTWRDTDGDEWCWHWAEDGWGYNHATFLKPFSECFPLIRVTGA